MKRSKIFLITCAIGILGLPLFYQVIAYQVNDGYHRNGSSSMGIASYKDPSGASWLSKSGTVYNNLNGKANERGWIYFDTGYVKFKVTDSESFTVNSANFWEIKAVFHFDGKNYGWSDTGFNVGIELYDSNWNLLKSELPSSGLTGWYITDGTFDTDYSRELSYYLNTGTNYNLIAYAYVKCWGSISDGVCNCYDGAWKIEFEEFNFDEV